jgi:Carboxypeptidase regulatory-like domain
MGDARKSLGWMVLLVAVLAAGGGAWWFLHGERAPDAEPAGGVIVSEAPPPPPKAELPVPVEPDRRPPPPPVVEAPRTGSVAGRVVTPDRRVLAGARVAAWRGATSPIPGLLSPGDLRLSAVADAEGRFTLADVPAMGDLLLRLEGEFAPAELGPFTVTVGETAELGDLVVQPGMAIAGEVRDESGGAVAGARIGLLQGILEVGPDGRPPDPARTVISDEHGRFSIEHAAPASFNLLVTAPGFARGRHAAAPAPGELPGRMDAFITLRRTRPLTGTVLAEPDGQPLRGALVVADALDQGNDGGSAVTGADGSYSIADVAPGSYGLVATYQGYSRGVARTQIDKPEAPVEIRLHPQGSLSGVVVDSQGRPVTAFDLQGKSHRRKLDGAVPLGPAQRVTSSDGSFRVEGLDPGWACVDVWAQGYALTNSECVRVLQGQKVDGLVVQLVRGAALFGRVVDETGAAVVGAKVSLHLNLEPDADFLRDDPADNPRLKATRTDADGRFRLEDLSPLVYQVEVDHPDHARLRQNGVRVVAEQENDAGTLLAARSATVRGAALDTAGNSIPGARVTLTLVNGPSREVTADGKGRFSFGRVAPGDYSLTCFGQMPSLGDMLVSLREVNNTFHLDAGQVLDLNVVSLN